MPMDYFRTRKHCHVKSLQLDTPDTFTLNLNMCINRSIVAIKIPWTIQTSVFVVKTACSSTDSTVKGFIRSCTYEFKACNKCVKFLLCRCRVSRIVTFRVHLWFMYTERNVTRK